MIEKCYAIQETLKYLQSATLTHREKSVLIAMGERMISLLIDETKRLQHNNHIYWDILEKIRSKVPKDIEELINKEVELGEIPF